jgi:pimeloyl-ACP methyl ester carboxylesterase
MQEEEMEPRVLQTDVKGEGDAIVLVPGGLTGWVSWMPHQERLAPRYKVVRVQPIHNELGSQGQRGDPTYNAETERETLRMTIDELKIPSAHFGGWSGGGRALIEFALEYPDRVRSLTLVEPAAYWALEQLGEKDPLLDETNDFLRARAGEDITEDDLAQFLRSAGFVQPSEDPRQHPNWERWVSHRMALSWQALIESSGRSIDELSGITAPTLLVKGTRSTDEDRRVVDVVAERIPNSAVTELEGDHACHIQEIDKFLEAFEKYLTNA